MPAKKTQQKSATEKEQKIPLTVTARIDRLVDYEGSSVRAVASVNVAGAFAIHGLKVIDSEKGPFVSMPQSRYEKDGKTQYSEICHPITAKARAELSDAVLTAYEQKLNEDVKMWQEQDAEQKQRM